jgi:hypothetical protein
MCFALFDRPTVTKHTGDRNSRLRATTVKLAPGHFLGHVQNQLTIRFVCRAPETAKLVEKARILAGAAPGNLVRGLAFGQIRQLGRLIAVVEELIEWDFESSCQLFQCLNRRNGMTVLDSRNVATKQSCALLDISLGKFLFFAQVAEAVTNNLGESISSTYVQSKR